MFTIGALRLVGVISPHRRWFVNLERANSIGFIVIGLAYASFRDAGHR
jgi:hypothetical protein